MRQPDGAALPNAPVWVRDSVNRYTDPVPVRGLKKSCGYFANNTQLSTLRATNVKEELLLGADKPRYRGRITVSGWGPEKLQPNVKPTAAVNRRVEIRFVWESDER